MKHSESRESDGTFFQLTTDDCFTVFDRVGLVNYIYYKKAILMNISKCPRRKSVDIAVPRLNFLEQIQATQTV